MDRSANIAFGVLLFLIGIGGVKAQNNMVETDGQKIELKDSPYSVDLKHGIRDLTHEDREQLKEILARSNVFIAKYVVDELPVSFASETLDQVLDHWVSDKDPNKLDQAQIVELVGCAFGQGIVEELDYEWKLVTDEYGTDHSVMDKQFIINGFPFSTVLKVIEEKRETRSLTSVKLVLKKYSIDASTGEKKFERR